MGTFVNVKFTLASRSICGSLLVVHPPFLALERLAASACVSDLQLQSEINVITGRYHVVSPVRTGTRNWY